MKRQTKIARAEIVARRQETQYTCMAASIASCLSVHHKQVTEEEVNRVLGAGPLRGARWEEALGTLQYFGMRGTLIVPGTLRMVKEATDAGNPVMIAWNPEGRPWSHASVIIDVEGDDFGLVHVHDPNCPDPDETVRVVPKAEFYKKWGEPIGDLMIVRRPMLIVEREVLRDGTQKRAKAAGKKERQQAKDRAKALKRKMVDPKRMSEESLSEAQKIEKKVRRQQAIQDGTYWGPQGGKHKNKKKYDRKQKHRDRSSWRAAMAVKVAQLHLEE